MRVSLRGLYPQYTFFSLGATVAKHKGASVAGGRRQINAAVGRDRCMASRQCALGDDVEAVT
jgi:hypothetical protein